MRVNLDWLRDWVELGDAEGVAADPGSLGIVLGGSGNGEQMAANKVTGIRAALCYDDELARLAMATERYCVVGQSLAHPPSIHVRRRSPESGGSAG